VKDVFSSVVVQKGIHRGAGNEFPRVAMPLMAIGHHTGKKRVWNILYAHGSYATVSAVYSVSEPATIQGKKAGLLFSP
jgi:hypothetical protein